MTGSTSRTWFLLSVRIVFIALAILAGAVYLFFMFSGYIAWKQSLANEIVIADVIMAVEVIILIPGLAPLLSAYYYFVYLKRPIYNLIGFFSLIVIVFVHLLASIMAAHSSEMLAIGISTLELLLVLAWLYSFQRFIVDKS